LEAPPSDLGDRREAQAKAVAFALLRAALEAALAHADGGHRLS
jgi:hypothetical protein